LVTFGLTRALPLIGVATASSAAALGAVMVLETWIMKRIEHLSATALEWARGKLDARAAEEGPAEIVQAARSFNEMAASIQRLFQARREMVAWVGHDLRTPVTSLQAMLDAVEDGLSPPERYLDAMREQVAALSGLIDDLFELARIDAGDVTLEIEEVKLEDLVASCVRGLQPHAQAKKVSLEARFERTLPKVPCAPDKVARVLANLVTNAVRHTPTGGWVRILAEAIDEEVRLSVEDSGEGIPSEALQRVFDRFWRGDSARSEAARSAGLGLAIARGLVAAHGGEIWAENAPAGGAKFMFTLPLGERRR
ncbi:MAG: HAMP domain-containing histidine kinase, partial [Actinobacteria bacterium]|nr:HAMP domain-containing histidine kinase [Actinomycetota bacterium]